MAEISAVVIHPTFEGVTGITRVYHIVRRFMAALGHRGEPPDDSKALT